MSEFVKSIVVDTDHEDPNAVRIIANGIDIQVSVYDEGMVYIDTYAMDRKHVVQVKHANIDVYKTDSPYIKVGLVKRP